MALRVKLGAIAQPLNWHRKPAPPAFDQGHRDAVASEFQRTDDSRGAGSDNRDVRSISAVVVQLPGVNDQAQPRKRMGNADQLVRVK